MLQLLTFPQTLVTDKAVLQHFKVFIDVYIDIYVMSSDLYGTCRHCLYGTLSRKCGHNCNPFGNVATALCKTLHWTQMADGSNVF